MLQYFSHLVRYVWYNCFLVPSLQARMTMSEAACDNHFVCSCCLTSGKRVDPICCAEGVVPEDDLVAPMAFFSVLIRVLGDWLTSSWPWQSHVIALWRRHNVDYGEVEFPSRVDMTRNAWERKLHTKYSELHIYVSLIYDGPFDQNILKTKIYTFLRNCKRENKKHFERSLQRDNKSFVAISN